MKPFIFISLLFLSCQNQADEPAIDELLAGDWNSVEYGVPGETQKGAIGELNNNYATGYSLNSDGSYGLFTDYDNDGEHEGGFASNNYWKTEENKLLFIDANTNAVLFQYRIKSVSKEELLLVIDDKTGFYIKFKKQ